MKSIISQTSEDTQKIAADFAKELRGGSVVCLYGDLGAGKTTFVQGLAKELGIKQRIISPTFIIARKYNLDAGKNFYHIDLYRIENEKDLEELGIDEILNDDDAIVAIEWAEKLGSRLPKNRTDIYFENIDDDKRQMVFQDSSSDIDKTVQVFNSGGVVIFPTDTAIGIGCRMDSKEAVKKVYEIKKRDYSKPLLVLASSSEMASQYVEIPEDVKEKLLDKYWPGGLTVILNCKKGKVDDLVNSEKGTLAIRIPDHKKILQVIRQVGVPIVATSANITGEKTPYKISEVDKNLTSQVDHVMEGECTFGEQSTIIDTTVSPWKVIREGAVKINL